MKKIILLHLKNKKKKTSLGHQSTTISTLVYFFIQVTMFCNFRTSTIPSKHQLFRDKQPRSPCQRRKTSDFILSLPPLSACSACLRKLLRTTWAWSFVIELLRCVKDCGRRDCDWLLDARARFFDDLPFANATEGEATAEPWLDVDDNDMLLAEMLSSNNMKVNKRNTCFQDGARAAVYLRNLLSSLVASSLLSRNCRFTLSCRSTRFKRSASSRLLQFIAFLQKKKKNEDKTGVMISLHQLFITQRKCFEFHEPDDQMKLISSWASLSDAEEWLEKIRTACQLMLKCELCVSGIYHVHKCLLIFNICFMLFLHCWLIRTILKVGTTF